jgi:hypothetical protein
MRAIVRLLRRLAVLVAAAVAIVIVSAWAAEARADRTTPELGGSFAGFDRNSAPERASPMPVSLDTCRGGGTSNSGRADPAGVLSTGADDATRRASLLVGSPAYTPSSDRDPLVRA